MASFDILFVVEIDQLMADTPRHSRHSAMNKVVPMVRDSRKVTADLPRT